MPKSLANLVFSYFSDRIDALGAGQLGNIIEKGVPTLDFVWKNQLNKNFEINASVKNILDPTIQRVRENVSFDATLANDLGINPNLSEFALSSYKRGVNASIQFKYKF